MPYEFQLPDTIAPAGSEGLLVTWFKDEGQQVAKGDLLLEVQFEKASTDVEAPASGVLSRILVRQGEIVRSGQVLCEIGETVAATGPNLASSAAGGPAAANYDAGAQAHTEAGERRASPAARRLAKELGVDLQQVVGTNPGGRITEADIRAATARQSQAGSPASATASGAAPSPGRREPLTPSQQTVAQRMTESLRATAQLTLGREIDASELVVIRQVLKTSGSTASLTDLVHRAVVLALAEHPRLQAQWQEDGTVVIPDGVNLGFAVARGEELLVPVIKGAHRLDLAGLAQERQRLSTAARSGRVSLQDLQDGTFTVTSLGPQGIEFFTPVINPPQAAILGVGRLVRRPGFQGDAVVPRHYMTLSLTFDHRVVNGAPAAIFLGRVAELLESPWNWLHVS